MYEVDTAALGAEIARLNWRVRDLAAIWQVSQATAAAYLRQPQKLSCRQLLLLQQAAGWNNAQAAGIFFARAPKTAWGGADTYEAL